MVDGSFTEEIIPRPPAKAIGIYDSVFKFLRHEGATWVQDTKGTGLPQREGEMSEPRVEKVKSLTRSGLPQIDNSYVTNTNK